MICAKKGGQPASENKKAFKLKERKNLPLYMWLCKINLPNTEPGESLWVMKCSHCCPQDLNSRGSNKTSSLIQLTEQFELLSCAVLRKLENLEKGQLAETRKTQRERSGKGRRQLQCKLQTSSSFGRDCASSCFTVQSGYSCTNKKEHGGKKTDRQNSAGKKSSVLSHSPFSSSIPLKIVWKLYAKLFRCPHKLGHIRQGWKT